MRLSYLYNGNSYTGKTTSSYWKGPLEPIEDGIWFENPTASVDYFHQAHTLPGQGMHCHISSLQYLLKYYIDNNLVRSIYNVYHRDVCVCSNFERTCRPEVKKYHCGDKMFLWLSLLHNGISCTDTSLYWNRAQKTAKQQSDDNQCLKLSPISCRSSCLESQIINIKLKKNQQKVAGPPPKLSGSDWQTSGNYQHWWQQRNTGQIWRLRHTRDSQYLPLPQISNNRPLSIQ